MQLAKRESTQASVRYEQLRETTFRVGLEAQLRGDRFAPCLPGNNRTDICSSGSHGQGEETALTRRHSFRPEG